MRRWLPMALLSVILLTGCWDRVEVNDLAIISMMGVDTAEEGVRLTVAIVVPTRIEGGTPAGGEPGGGGGGGRRAVALFAANGRTIMDAMMQVQMKVSRRLFWSHASVLVIGDELAREGVRDVMDFWTRHREPRYRIKVVVTPGTAEEVLQFQPQLEQLLSEAVREVINLRFMAEVTILDFVLSLRTQGEHPLAPRIARTDDGTSEASLKVNGTAIFRDDKLVGYLNIPDSRGLLWLRNEIDTGVVTLEVPGGGYVSTYLLRSNTRVSARMVGGELRMHVQIETEDDVYESSALVDFDKPETIPLLRGLLANAIKDRIEPALKKVQQEYQVDVLKFGDAVRRDLPFLWERGLKDQWQERFPEVPVDIEVIAHIRRTGEHGIPLGATKEEVEARQRELAPRGE